MRTNRLPWCARPPSWPEVFVLVLAWLLTGCGAALPIVAASSAAAGQTIAAHMPDNIDEGGKKR